MRARAASKALKARKAELKRQARAARLALKARREALVTPEVEAARARKRRRRIMLFLLLVLLLLLLLVRCECDAPPVSLRPAPGVGKVATPPDVTPPSVKPQPPPARKVKRKRKRTRIKRRERPAFEAVASGPPPWLARFRLQVAARSPRMSACFEGAGAPGALKWTASVDAKTGRVSDHVLEPVLVGGSLGAKRRQCLIEVLSAPYRLPAGEGDGLPSRVSIVIEF